MRTQYSQDQLERKSSQTVGLDNMEEVVEFFIKNIMNASQTDIANFDLRSHIRRGGKAGYQIYCSTDMTDVYMDAIDSFSENMASKTSVNSAMVHGYVTANSNLCPADINNDRVYTVDISSNTVKKITIDSESATSSGVRKIRGLPIEKDDGSRLAFKNPKSGSDTIHITDDSDTKNWGRKSSDSLGSSYGWSVCGFGSSRKTEDNAIYINPSEFDDEYIVRNGEVVGKLCGNCRNTLQS